MVFGDLNTLPGPSRLGRSHCVECVILALVPALRWIGASHFEYRYASQSEMTCNAGTVTPSGLDACPQ